MIRRDVLVGGGLAAAGAVLADRACCHGSDGGSWDGGSCPGMAPADKRPRAADILRNPAKERLKRGEVVISMSVRLVRTMEIAQLAATSGFDSLYVEMQHSTFTEEQICQATLGAGITANGAGRFKQLGSLPATNRLVRPPLLSANEKSDGSPGEAPP
jgi:hypothetical protein